LKILVAEDEQAIAHMYKLALEGRKHEVTVVSDGDACVGTYETSRQQAKNDDDRPFDVVLLDHRMPRRDGIEVAKKILAADPGQRIIFASAYSKDILFDSVKRLKKVSEIIQKPFDLDELVSMIENREAYGRLEKLNEEIGQMADSDLTRERIMDFAKRLKQSR
jgi:CheY-like chemotaxis protein